MIDSGKVNQINCNPWNESTSLSTAKISQACAIQRAGRAGRTRNGICYCLYSSKQFKAMDKFTTPEITRVPLTEICLYTKALAGTTSIENYLSKALDPPPKKNIRTSIELLKKINALDSVETITKLGMHLIRMPVDCQLGKMLLYAVLLQCLDPVIEIVSALSVNDLFKHDDNEEKVALINSIKEEFAANSCSDHEMLHNVYEAWAKHPQPNDFCAKKFISNIQALDKLKKLIRCHLDRFGYISNALDYNRNSSKMELVKFCLAAGAFPNFCTMSMDGRIISKIDMDLSIYKSSIVKYNDIAQGVGPKLLLYGTKISTFKKTLIKHVTIVSPIQVILAAGTASYNPMENNENSNFGRLVVDDWMRFVINEKDAEFLLKLKSKFTSKFEIFLTNPSTLLTIQPIIRVFCDVIEKEDRIQAAIKSNNQAMVSAQKRNKQLLAEFCSEPGMEWD